MAGAYVRRGRKRSQNCRRRAVGQGEAAGQWELASWCRHPVADDRCQQVDVRRVVLVLGDTARCIIDTDQIARVSAGLSAFLNQVQQRDRLGVMLAAAPPTRLRSLEFGRPAIDVSVFAGENYAAPFDAIAAAMREFTGSDRRRALVAFTNAADFRSIIRFGALAEMARRLGPQFVLVGTPIKVDEAVNASAMTSSGRQIGDTVSGVVSGSILPATLQLLARRTGGITLNLGSGEPSRLIEAMFTWLRTQYVVSYEPPAGKGWHPVSVTVNRRGAKVTVRDGYFVD